MPVATAAAEKMQRFGSIDAVRGTAILFVFLSHFTAGYTWTSGSQETANYLRTLSMIASPTFVIVSGMVAGFLRATNPGGFTELRVKLFDRGIFLLLLGHLLLTLTLTQSPAHFSHAFKTSFITDAIAVAILIGPSMVALLSARQRVAIAALVYVAAWWVIVHWHPTGIPLVAKLYVVGLTGSAGELGLFPVFPIVPWFAVYLAGTALGERVGAMYVSGQPEEAHYLLARTGAASFAVAILAYGVARSFGGIAVASGADMNRLSFLSIYGKFPPGAVYLAFFGGAGLMMLATIFELDRQKKMPLLFGELRKLGRSSLFMFTVQYALYRALLPRIGFRYTPFWPLIFLGSVVLLTCFAELWDRRSANRYLTVGITRAWIRSRRRRQPTAVRGHSTLRLPAARRSLSGTIR